MSELHDTARAWAQSGVPVFPCWPGTKIPATDHGFKDGTTDLEQIDKWWTDNPNYNIAFEPGAIGCTVVDPEFEADPDWHDDRELPETFTVRTPRGGKHLYYVGECASSVKKLARDVDTRGKGGYVLIPPSVVEGKSYVLLDNREMGPLPAWIPELVGRQKEKRVAAADVILDTPANVARATHYLKQIPPTWEGDGSDNKAYVAACWLHELGVSDGTAVELMMEHFRCEPLTEDWVETKVASAYQRAQNEAGASGLSRETAEVFADAPAVLTSRKEAEKIASRFHFRDDAEMDASPKPMFIVPGLIPVGQVCIYAAKKGSFKTFLSLDLGLGIATNTLALGIKPTLTGPVFYGAHEGRYAIEGLHRPAWRLARGIKGSTQFYVGQGPRVAIEEERNEFIEQIRKRAGAKHPRLIVLDTYSACMLGLDESSPSAANTMIAFCRDMIALWPGCSVLIDAHFGKDESLGVRGSNSLEAGVDTVIYGERTEGTKIVKLTVKNHRSAPEPEHPFFFEGKDLAGSLVFQPLTQREHTTIMAQERPITKTKVAQALKAMNAYDPNEVTTAVLVGEMFRREQTENEDQYLARCRRMEYKLREVARTSLAAYRRGEGRDLRWSMPVREIKDDEDW